MPVRSEPLIYVGLESWIIQDGNYGDFAVGDLAHFALELFAVGNAHPTGDEGPLAARHRFGAYYRIRGRVAFVADGVWVVDAGGFLAYGTPPPSPADVGAIHEGDIYLGIDPFTYFERLRDMPGMPPLSYPWRIREIHLETTPRLDCVMPARGRDESKTSYTPVQATNAWADNDGKAHYLLACSMEGPPAVRP